MRLALAGLALLMGAACAQPPLTYRDLDRLGAEYQRDASKPSSERPAQGEDTCGMARFEHLIGTPAENIDRTHLPPRTRIITPDMMVTQDYAPGRLNIMVGSDGLVASLRCF